MMVTQVLAKVAQALWEVRADAMNKMRVRVNESGSERDNDDTKDLG